MRFKACGQQRNTGSVKREIERASQRACVRYKMWKDIIAAKVIIRDIIEFVINAFAI